MNRPNAGGRGRARPEITPGAPLPTAAECWEAFEASVMPDDAQDVQRYETRKAFYAGFWSMLSICNRIGEPDVPEADGVAMLERLQRECASWIRNQIAREGG